MSRKITVYSKDSCGQCTMTKNTLKRKGVEFEEIRADAPGMEDLAQSIRDRAAEKGITGSFPYVTVYDSDNVLVADWFGFIPANINDHAAVQDEDVAA